MKFYINMYHNAEGKLIQSTETFSFKEQAQAAVLTFVDTVEMLINEPDSEPIPDIDAKIDDFKNIYPHLED